MKMAIAIAEFVTVSAGISAADTMAKTAEIDILEAQAVCPGKYLIVIAGLLSAVSAAVEAARGLHGSRMISAHILGNPHEGLLGAFYGTAKIEQIRALGVFETFDAATMIFAADAAAKTAIVDLIEIRLAKGMCGKSYATMTGEIAAITAAIDRAAAEAAKSGMHLDSAIIANPDKKLSKFLM